MAGLNLTKLEAKNETEKPIEATNEVEAEDEFVYYTCAPIANFGIGSKYRFVDKQLKLPKSEEAAFDSMLKTMDARTKQVVKKIDVNRANAFVQALKPVATKNIDSGAMLENQSKTLVGRTPLEQGSDV